MFTSDVHVDVDIHAHVSVIGSEVYWLDCPACNAFVVHHNGRGINLYGVVILMKKCEF